MKTSCTRLLIYNLKVWDSTVSERLALVLLLLHVWTNSNCLVLTRVDLGPNGILTRRPELTVLRCRERAIGSVSREVAFGNSMMPTAWCLRRDNIALVDVIGSTRDVLLFR